MIHSCSYYCHKLECIKAQRDELRDKLYKRQWVGLTKEEVSEIASQGHQRWLDFYYAIEAKLKEKNT